MLHYRWSFNLIFGLSCSLSSSLREMFSWERTLHCSCLSSLNSNSRKVILANNKKLNESLGSQYFDARFFIHQNEESKLRHIQIRDRKSHSGFQLGARRVARSRTAHVVWIFYAKSFVLLRNCFFNRLVVNRKANQSLRYFWSRSRSGMYCAIRRMNHVH